MSTKTTTIIAGLTMAWLALAADAAHAAHGVQATASANARATVTNGTGWLASQTLAQAAIGPETLDNGSVVATAESWTETTPGLLSGWAEATSAINNTKQIPNNTPSAYTEAVYQDSFRVVSDTLPAGTPVQLVFRNEVVVATAALSGNYDGQIYSQLNIGVAAVTNTWRYRFDAGAPQIAPQVITVNTKVGSVLAVEQRFRVSSRAIYVIGTPTGPSFGAIMELDASARLTLASAPEGVSIAAESGAAFPVAGL